VPWRAIIGSAGVAHPERESTQVGGGSLCEFIDERTVGDVTGYGNRATSEATHPLGDGFDLVDSTRGQHDIAACLSERNCDSFTDASTGAGDHRPTSIERESIQHCHVSPSLSTMYVDLWCDRPAAAATIGITTVSTMFGGPVQIAYAVVDVERAAVAWAERGVGPFFVRDRIEVTNARIHGRPASFDHSSAFAQWGDVMVELIHQHDDGADPIVGTSGIHHVAHFVDEFAAATASLTAAGCGEVLYAETSTGMPFAFHDGLDERDHLIEIYERTPALERFYDMVRDTAAGWDGADPVRHI